MKHLISLLIVVSSFAGRAQDADPSAYVESYVVIAGESEDFTSIEGRAKELSAKTSIRYDAGGLVWDSVKGLIFPGNSDDAIYAGSYHLRRYDDNRISIEMRDHYFDVKPGDISKKMIIVAGIYGSKADAAKRLKQVKAFAPSAYIRRTKIYMGCIH